MQKYLWFLLVAIPQAQLVSSVCGEGFLQPGSGLGASLRMPGRQADPLVWGAVILCAQAGRGSCGECVVPGICGSATVAEHTRALSHWLPLLPTRAGRKTSSMLEVDDEGGRMFLRVLLHLTMHDYAPLVSGALQLLFKHFSQRQEAMHTFKQVRGPRGLVAHGLTGTVGSPKDF